MAALPTVKEEEKPVGGRAKRLGIANITSCAHSRTMTGKPKTRGASAWAFRGASGARSNVSHTKILSVSGLLFILYIIAENLHHNILHVDFITDIDF